MNEAVAQHPAFAQENGRLQETLKQIQSQQKTAQAEKAEAASELETARRFDPDGLPVREMLFAQLSNAYNTLLLAEKKPYFTRIDFSERPDKSETFYIGKYGIWDRKTQDSIVIDWRAPLANLYYAGRLGHVSYTAPDGSVEGELTLKRQFEIQEGHLESIFDTDIVSQDAYLQSALNQMNGERLKEIVTTIQSEQNLVIRSPLKQNLIVQGAAGSGKTTIALHRIAYLLYAYKEQLHPENMLILAPSPLFLNYISGVLPDLGVERVKQTTFARFLREVSSEKIPLPPENDRTEAVLALSKAELSEKTRVWQFKGSRKMAVLLEVYFKEYEAKFAPEEGLSFGPISLYTKKEMDDFLLIDEAPFPMARRVQEFKKQLTLRVNAAVKRLVNWYGDECLRRATKIRQTEPNAEAAQARVNKLFAARDERIQQTKAQAKPFIKQVLEQFPATDALSVYRDFWQKQLSSEDADAVLAAKHSLALLEGGKSATIEKEDLAPLMLLFLKLEEAKKPMMRHIVIDEAQDFSVLEIYALNRLMPSATFTIVGDLMQGIHMWRGIDRWQALSDGVFGKNVCFQELLTSYRSTVEIMQEALKVSENKPIAGQKPARAVVRHGEKPQYVSFASEKEQISLLEQTVSGWQNSGLAVIAIVTANETQAKALIKKLPASMNAKLLNPNDETYSGAVQVAPASCVKGLEFDGVIVADADEMNYPDEELPARLLYVALTRPLHRLKILYRNRLTPLLKSK